MSTIARWLRGFGAFWWDFIVGDDWLVAAGVVVSLAVTAALAGAGLPAWWFLPVAVLVLLGVSLRRGIADSGASPVHRSVGRVLGPARKSPPPE